MNKLFIKTTQPFNSLQDVISTLFTGENGYPKSYANPTYADEACEIVEGVGQRRSFEDLLVLARTYFPDTTDAELMGVLLDQNLSCWYCGDIFKIVFWKTIGISDYEIKKRLPVEAGLTDKLERKYQKYSWRPEDLIDLYKTA